MERAKPRFFHGGGGELRFRIGIIGEDNREREVRVERENRMRGENESRQKNKCPSNFNCGPPHT